MAEHNLEAVKAEMLRDELAAAEQRRDRLLEACRTWRKAVEDDELAGAFPSMDDKALFHAMDKLAEEVEKEAKS